MIKMPFKKVLPKHPLPPFRFRLQGPEGSGPAGEMGMIRGQIRSQAKARPGGWNAHRSPHRAFCAWDLCGREGQMAGSEGHREGSGSLDPWRAPLRACSELTENGSHVP